MAAESPQDLEVLHQCAQGNASARDADHKPRSLDSTSEIIFHRQGHWVWVSTQQGRHDP